MERIQERAGKMQVSIPSEFLLLELKKDFYKGG